MMDTLRTVRPGIRVIFPSSLAVFEPAVPKGLQKVTENTMPLPQSSYGSQKQMGETLLNDYSEGACLMAKSSSYRKLSLDLVGLQGWYPVSVLVSFASH